LVRSVIVSIVFQNFGFRPLVVQERNPHSHEADFVAELPLYIQAKALSSLIVNNYINKKGNIFVLSNSIKQTSIYSQTCVK
jgi:hypothetical protein